jgi:hypothetical protein
MSKYAYTISVKLPDESVKRFGYPVPTAYANTWVMVGEKQKLAEEYGVPLDDVTVHIPGHGAIL